MDLMIPVVEVAFELDDGENEIVWFVQRIYNFVLSYGDARSVRRTTLDLNENGDGPCPVLCSRCRNRVFRTPDR